MSEPEPGSVPVRFGSGSNRAEPEPAATPAPPHEEGVVVMQQLNKLELPLRFTNDAAPHHQLKNIMFSVSHNLASRSINANFTKMSHEVCHSFVFILQSFYGFALLSCHLWRLCHQTRGAGCNFLLWWAILKHNERKSKTYLCIGVY